MSQHSAKGARWERTRREVIARAGGLCQIRNPAVCTGHATTVDHILERRHGGTNDPRNLRAACGPCNTARNRPRPTVDNRWAL